MVTRLKKPGKESKIGKIVDKYFLFATVTDYLVGSASRPSTKRDSTRIFPSTPLAAAHQHNNNFSTCCPVVVVVNTVLLQ